MSDDLYKQLNIHGKVESGTIIVTSQYTHTKECELIIIMNSKKPGSATGSPYILQKRNLWHIQDSENGLTVQLSNSINASKFGDAQC